MKKYWTFGGLFIITCIAFWIYDGKAPQVQEDKLQESEGSAPLPKEENLLYGINVDDVDIVEGVVKRNQTLSTILAPLMYLIK